MVNYFCQHDWVERTEELQKVFWKNYRYWVCTLCCKIKWEVNDNG